MKIGICLDNTFPLALTTLTNNLNQICCEVSFVVIPARIRIETPYVSAYETHQNALESLGDIEECDIVILTTMIQYDDNFFFHAHNGLYIISFFGWNLLTDLPVSNGLVYFLAEIIADHLGMGPRHQQNTGCMNDFLEDKTGIDIGMRSAYLCYSCQQTIKSQQDYDKKLLVDLMNILDLLSRSSRANLDITEMDATAFTPGGNIFDLFLCHNSQDKPEIREINTILKSHSIKTWFDEDQLPLGVPWQPELEKEIGAIRNAAVFVGESGIGPWQDFEIRSFLSEFASRGCPVIPVILTSATSTPKLPLFLQQMTWIDLRDNRDNKIDRLVASVKRIKNS